MDDFAKINAVYTTFFGTSPPARACVAVDLPSPLRLKLDCIAYAGASPHDRRALHVQGLSYWAPANIGPYSQAIVVSVNTPCISRKHPEIHIEVGDLIFVSGQIGMLPRSLALPTPRSFAQEVALASQHAQRIIDVLKSSTGGGWAGHPMLNIFWYSRTLDAIAIKGCTVSL
jgi:diphthine-ammonia ligase